MYITWRQRLQQQPSLRSIREWPFIDVLALPEAKRRQFTTNRTMVAKALAQQPLNAIEREFYYTHGRLTHLLNRCLGGDSESSPALTKGLIPKYRLSSGERRQPLSTLVLQSGAGYAFKHLLATVPGLAKHLRQKMELRERQDKHGENLSPGDFHQAVISYLREAGWPEDTYPFTEANQGYEAARLYYHHLRRELSAPSPQKKVNLPTARPVGTYQEIEIDEYTVDAESSFVLVLNEKWEPLRISRFTLIVARDVATGAVLAFHIAFAKAVDTGDMLQLFDNMFAPPRKIICKTPGMKYPDGDTLPTDLGEAFRRPTLGIVRLDNAMVHLADVVQELICDDLGATVNLGIVKCPLARSIIEAVFDDLNDDVHRLPSTTGSHPRDPKKEPAKNRKTPPEVSIIALEEMIAVHIAHLNNRPMANHGGSSPMQSMRYEMANHWIALRPACVLEQCSPLQREVIVPVHREKSTNRGPWINFMYTRYKNPSVIPNELIGQKIRIRYHYNHIRSVEAYTLTGEFLGILYAPMTWQRFDHGIRTRRYIHRLVTSGKLNQRDPFEGYFGYLMDGRHNPSTALEIIRVTREMSGPITIDLSPEEQTATAPSMPVELQALATIPDWSPTLFLKEAKS